jgi:hypothetical protein
MSLSYAPETGGWFKILSEVVILFSVVKQTGDGTPSCTPAELSEVSAVTSLWYTEIEDVMPKRQNLTSADLEKMRRSSGTGQVGWLCLPQNFEVVLDLEIPKIETSRRFVCSVLPCS